MTGEFARASGVSANERGVGYSISNGRVRLYVVKECTMRERVDFANEVFVCMQQKDRVRWKGEGCETRPGGRQEEGSDEAYETNTPKTS